ARLGAQAGARGPAQGRARGPCRRTPRGDPSRPLARGLDHRGLCELGLRRAPGLPGQQGHAADRRRPPRLVLHAEAGSGRTAPRPWQNTGRTPIQNVASGFFQEPGNFVEWYFPARLTLDVDGANALSRNAVTNYLGLRTWHRAEIDVPLYAEQTLLTHGRVLR